MKERLRKIKTSSFVDSQEPTGIDIARMLPLENEIICWKVNLSSLADGELILLNNSLSIDEKLKACNFRNLIDKNRYVAAHGVLGILLKALAGEDIKITANKYGKPNVDGSSLQFNLSHSGDLILLAFSLNKPLGIDVEKVWDSGDLKLIAAQNFHPKEVSAISKSSEELRSQAFFSCWTKKESVSKALGLGLTLPLHSYSVSIEPFEGDWDLELPNQFPQKWTLTAFQPQEGYFAAIACPFPNMRIKVYNFDFIASQYLSDPSLVSVNSL